MSNNNKDLLTYFTSLLTYLLTFVSDIAVKLFVLKRDVKLQQTNQPTNQLTYIIMVALCNRADHYIFAL